MTKLLTTQNFIYLTLFFTPAYLIKFSIFKIPTNLSEIFILLTILTWFLKNRFTLFLKLRSFLKQNKAIALSIFLMILGLFISSFINNNLFKELSIIKSWFILPILFGFIIFDQTKNKHELNKILNTIFYSSGFISVISLFYLTSTRLTYDNRLQSFYLSPNHLAMILAPGLLIGIWSGFSQKKILPLEFLLIFNILLILFFTHSYTTWLAILFSLFFMTYFLASSKQKILSILSIIFIFSIFLIYENDSEKFRSLLNLSERSSLGSRIMIWQSAHKILLDNWIWGIGPGNFQEKYLDYQKYFPLYLEWAVPQPHNLFLAFWLQSGLIGFFGFIFLLIYICLKKIKILLYSKDFYQKNISLLFLSFILQLLLIGLLDTPYWKNDLSLIFWSIIFLSISIYSSNLD